jgi:hypothetical protein
MSKEPWYARISEVEDMTPEKREEWEKERREDLKGFAEASHAYWEAVGKGMKEISPDEKKPSPGIRFKKLCVGRGRWILINENALWNDD